MFKSCYCRDLVSIECISELFQGRHGLSLGTSCKGSKRRVQSI